MREVPNKTNGSSPYQMVYGQLGRGPLSILKDTWTGELTVPPDFGKITEQYMQDLKERLEIAKLHASEHAEKAQLDYANRYNVHTRSKEFRPGDQVIVLMPDSAQKLYSRWTRPANVKELILHDKDSYIIVMDDGSERKLHANKLRLFQNRVNSIGVSFDNDNEFGVVECMPVVNDTTAQAVQPLFE